MNRDKTKSSSSFAGSNQRAFERHPLDLAAKITIPGAAATHRKIKDFCIGGMLLVDEQHGQQVEVPATYQLNEGDLIDISFSIGMNDEQHCLHARIVHHGTDSFGVALLDPDLTIIQLLMEFAKTHQQRPDETVKLDPSLQVNTDLIAECIKLVVSCVAILSVKTHEIIINSLFEQSKSLKNISDQNMYFETLGIFNDKKEKFLTAFQQSAIEHMACSQNGQLTGADSDVLTSGATELALVEEEALDNWLADTGTIETVQRTHNELLMELTKRLSEVFAIPVNNENNPYGPALFTLAFHDAISDFGLHHKMSLVCHKVFKELLVTMVGDLYTKLNRHLIDKGVLPTLTYEFSHAEESEKEEEVLDTSLAVEAGNNSVLENQSLPENQSIPENQSVPENQSIPGNLSNHNIYELVAELRTLKRQLHGQAGRGAGAADSVTDVAGGSQPENKGTVLTQNEILQTLSRIESSCGELGREDFKALIYSSLTEAVDDDGQVKVVAVRENQIIDVSNSIFDMILTDVQVPKSMHTWLARMEMPVLKMAIEDDSLFLDRDHLVRQVVNKIAQLGLLIGEEESEGTEGVRKALDWLVELIGSEFDGTLSVFHRVSDQLDLLIKAQDKKYEEKLKLVIHEYEESTEKEDIVTPNLEGEFESGDAYDEWLRRAHRIEEGDWVLFDRDKEKSKRLRAAWIAHHTGRVVFVDVIGNKERIIFFEEFAVLLYSGKAMMLDDANEPAMDRAQYTMLEELNAQLVHESTHDPLTGLINRREFEKQIGKALISVRHTDIRYALLFIDLDQFNIINTTYGYEAGDQLLIEISKIFSENQGHKYTLARLGSDEFGLLIEDIDLEESLEIAEEHIYLVREHKFMWQAKRVSIGVSIGLVTLNKKSESITSLMQAAESSCVLAKEVGGNRTQLYSSGQMRISHRSEMINWVSRIDDVLDQGKLRLRCQKIQPITPGNSSKPHYEILLVLVDDHNDSVSIQDFIEAAEWSNRIIDIDRWVIREALAWISNNKSVLDNISSFSINLSGRSLSDESLVNFIINEIETSGVPPAALCFEITETTGVESLSDAADFIHRIKTTGCHFSLDDFGSGMSSYAYLKNLPVDYLKIDGMFIKEIKSSASDYAVVKSICEIGHFMGKQVIAEYVENEDILNMLVEIGVDFAQGYGVEKPIMINELLLPR